MIQTYNRVRRYSRYDQLALCMIWHGARISTVRAWTGLSAKRIRTLGQQNACVSQVLHRGQITRRLAYFFRTPLVTSHAAWLGHLFQVRGVLPNTGCGRFS